MQEIKFDEIGYWSEIKLEIIKRYATEYSKILNASTEPAFHHVYIDAFSGPGEHISRETGETVLGSPLIALGIDPPFKKYYYIDIESDKVDYLREAIGDRDDVKTYVGDCNNILIDEVFPEIKYEIFVEDYVC